MTSVQGDTPSVQAAGWRSRCPDCVHYVLAQDFNSIGDDPSRTKLPYAQVRSTISTIWTERWWSSRLRDEGSRLRRSTIDHVEPAGWNRPSL